MSRKAKKAKRAAVLVNPSGRAENDEPLSFAEKDRRQLLEIAKGDTRELGATCEQWGKLREFARRYERHVGNRELIVVRPEIAPWHFYENTKSPEVKTPHGPKPTPMLWAEHLRDATARVMLAIEGDRESLLVAQQLFDALTDAIEGRESDIRAPLERMRPIVGMLAQRTRATNQRAATAADRVGSGVFGKHPETRAAVDRWRAAIACTSPFASFDGREKWTQQQHRQELSEACAELAEALRSEGIDESPAWAMQLRVNKGWGAEALEPFLDDVLVALVRLSAATKQAGEKPAEQKGDKRARVAEVVAGLMARGMLDATKEYVAEKAGCSPKTVQRSKVWKQYDGARPSVRVVGDLDTVRADANSTGGGKRTLGQRSAAAKGVREEDMSPRRSPHQRGSQ